MGISYTRLAHRLAHRLVTTTTTSHMRVQQLSVGGSSAVKFTQLENQNVRNTRSTVYAI